MADLNTDDIRASVAAGVIDEAQAAQILATSHDRQGYRAHMNDDDEPFELFKGFSEIFVTVGLSLLTAGIIAVSLATSSLLIVAIIAAGLAVAFARYFTLKRRMTLPSIFLAACFGLSVLSISTVLVRLTGAQNGWLYLSVFSLTAIGLFGYFRAFRVPFTMFLIGLCGVGVAYSLTGIAIPGILLREGLSGSSKDFLDLGSSPVLSLTLLAFGIVAFIGGMAFDLKDPHRISRHGSSAFWLHILAAPAIVNVVVVSLLAVEGVAGYVLAAAALAVITIIALIIDRRSFLTAGIIYIGVILTWAISATSIGDGWGFIWTLLLMGAFITWLGAWWVPMRALLMRLLPDFPYKNQLPPYSEAK